MDSKAGEIPVHLGYAKNLPVYKHERPYSILSAVKENVNPNNLVWENGEEEIMHDARGYEKDFNLDTHGFCWRKHPSSLQSFDCSRSVEMIYLPEIKKMLEQELEGVDRVVFFDWRRRGPPAQFSDGKIAPSQDMNNPLNTLVAARQVHLDQSPFGVLKRVRALMGDEASYLLQGRVRVVNVWRPLHTVEDDILALADGRTIGYPDLLEVDLIRQHYVGSTMFGLYRPGYKWYYLRDQTKDEVCLFKNFDSDDEVPSQICPHVSFKPPQQSIPRPRESIEVRALVFTYPERDDTVPG